MGGKPAVCVALVPLLLPLVHLVAAVAATAAAVGGARTIQRQCWRTGPQAVAATAISLMLRGGSSGAADQPQLLLELLELRQGHPHNIEG